MPSNQIRTFREAVAIVTGGASGIGRALSWELSRRGAQIVLADRQIEMAEQVACQIRKEGGRATAAEIDVTDYAGVERLIGETVENGGRLDYLFNNAGIVVGGAIGDMSVDDWNRMIDVNLRGVVHGVNAAYRVMKKQGFGHIVNTASMAGLMINPMNIPYGTTKYAVVGLTQSLRAEASHLGIRASVICPGLIRTPILNGGKFGAMKVSISEEKLMDLWEELKPMDPDIFARKVLAAVAKNKAVIILPSFWKIIWWLNRISPSGGIAFARYRYAKVRSKYGL